MHLKINGTCVKYLCCSDKETISSIKINKKILTKNMKMHIKPKLNRI